VGPVVECVECVVVELFGLWVVIGSVVLPCVVVVVLTVVGSTVVVESFGQ